MTDAKRLNDQLRIAVYVYIRDVLQCYPTVQVWDSHKALLEALRVPEINVEGACPHPLDEHAWLSDDVFMCCACGQRFIANDPALIDGEVSPGPLTGASE